MARRSNPSAKPEPYDELPIRGAPLQPIRYVERELTAPDGKTVVVEVPVYPPFQLEPRKPAEEGGESEASEGEERDEPRAEDDA